MMIIDKTGSRGNGDKGNASDSYSGENSFEITHLQIGNFAAMWVCLS